MYLLDSNSGRSRRAIARDKAASLYNDSAYYADKIRRDFRNRAAEMAVGAKARLTPDDEIADQKLEARVRAELGRVTSDPHPIQIRAENGCVTVDGPILAMR